MKKVLGMMMLTMLAFIFVACGNTAVDTTRPVISGTSNFTHEIGDSEPNWLAGVSALDDVDGAVDVTIDKSAVNLNEVGVYDLIYKAVDSAGNEATRTVKVTVVEKDTTKPVISGTKNFTVEQGSDKPNWLQGVTVTDNKDNNPTITVNDSAVKLDTIGTYNLVYTATDASGNETVVTVTVTVIEPAVEETVSFGTDPYNQSATTTVSGVGVALYYDAMEDDEIVPTDKVTFVIVDAPEGATGNDAAEFGILEAKDVHYFRAYVAGTYVIKAVVTDKLDRSVDADSTHSIEVSAVSTNQADDKVKVRSIYPNNLAANPDYRTNEGTQNEFLVVGKNFTAFKRHEPFYGTNYAAMFVGFSDFEGGEALDDFTISFKFTALNTAWKVLFSMFSGEVGADDWSGDWVRLLTHNNQAGLVGDAQGSSEFGDLGEAEDVMFAEGVYIKITRTIEEGNVTLKLYTSVDGITYTEKISVLHADASIEAGGMGAKLTGFAIFSIDNDFIMEDLEVNSTVFSLA